jgi:hypothetical protein
VSCGAPRRATLLTAARIVAAVKQPMVEQSAPRPLAPAWHPADTILRDGQEVRGQGVVLARGTCATLISCNDRDFCFSCWAVWLRADMFPRMFCSLRRYSDTLENCGRTSTITGGVGITESGYVLLYVFVALQI